jgi:hypothetical protein
MSWGKRRNSLFLPRQHGFQVKTKRCSKDKYIIESEDVGSWSSPKKRRDVISPMVWTGTGYQLLI